MTYPAGYRSITWNEVATSPSISHVYILEDGRDKPYGPYKVISAATGELEDPNATYDMRFFSGVNEVIGIPDPNYQGGGVTSATTPSNAVPAPFVTPTALSALAAQAYDTLFDAFVVHLATKSLQIDAATRMQLESDLVVKRNIAIKALTDALKRP